MNPNKPDDFKRLTSAVKESRRRLQPFREKRKSLLTMFVGDQYSDDGEAKTVYLNMIALATSIYVRQLAVRAPTARVVTPYPELRPMASNFTLACKDVAKDTGLGVTLRRVVTDALFSPMAVVKIGLAKAGTRNMGGVEVPVTEPFVKLVSFDDYVRDMSARSAYEPAFEGNMYAMPLDEVLERYPAAKVMNLTEGLDEESDTDRAETISHERGSGSEDFRRKIELQDVWLPKERLLITYAIQKPERPLEVVKFDGKEEGPYRSLWFTPVPDNAMPLPPWSVLRNINALAGSLFRRMAAQAQGQKRVVAFADEESANRFKNAHDGEGVRWSGQAPQNIEVGGIDPRTMALFLQVKDIFSWASGNLDTMGGLSPMAETAKQEGLLAQSSSAQIADMQDAVTVFAESIFRTLAWYEWTDPIRTRTLQKPVPGTDISISTIWSPETRQGDFLDFNFTIIPQSMREDSPAAKVQKLIATMQQAVMPFMSLFEAQGLGIDGRRYISLISDYANLPELEGIVIAKEAPASSGFPGDPEPRLAGDAAKPAVTTRNYVRTNRTGATRVGKEKALMQTLMGGGVQPAEESAMWGSVA